MSSTELVDRAYGASSSPSRTNKQTETSERVVCYVCGGNGANWLLYTKANDNDKSPYFPFLESVEKAKGAKAMKLNGRIDACTVCFSFLLQQWRSYEEMCTPVDKRTYWLKRTGAGGIDFSNYRGHGFAVDDATTRELTYFDKSEGIVEAFKNVERSEKDEGSVSVLSDDTEDEQEKARELSEEISEHVTTMPNNVNKTEKESEHLKDDNCIKIIESETHESCFVCDSQKVKDVMRIIHTKPQLKTETPFFPFLAHHHSPSKAKKMDFTGKVTVCEDCDFVLLKQWKVFEKQGTPLSERRYHLPFEEEDYEKQQTSSSMVCFICGESYPENSAWDLYVKKERLAEPYFPFLSKLSPAPGATPPIEGRVRACTRCHKSLVHQWDVFETRGASEHERDYNVQSKLRSVPTAPSYSEPKDLRSEISCFLCKVLYPSHKIEHINPPLHEISTSREQHSGKIPVCCNCKKILNAKATKLEPNNNELEKQCSSIQPPYSERHCIENSSNAREYLHPVSYEKRVNMCKENSEFEVCFLCGEKVKRANSKCLYVLPRQDSNGFKPFFPSLAYMRPAYHARPLASSGTVVVCYYCHGNMTTQWYEFEKPDNDGITNPWSRKYFLTQFTCYLCGKIYSRQKIASISVRDYPFLNKVRRPVRAFRINNHENYIVCHHCKEIVYAQKENFDKCGVSICEREYELPMVTDDSKIGCISKTLKRKAPESHLSSGHTVVVIGDSESEGDDIESPSKLEESVNVSNDLNSSNLPAGTGHKPLALQPQAKESTVQGLPMSSSATRDSGFAAALRKLAKQAMSPGAQSPVAIPPTTNPTMSPVKSKGWESPKLNGGPSTFKKEVPDPSFLSSKENRGHPNLPTPSDLVGIPTATSMGHQVVPGVFSLGSRGYESKSNPLEELHGQSHMQDISRVRGVPPQPPSHPFYVPFLQRPTMGDSVYMPPFHYYGPPMVDGPGFIPPPGFDHEAWRKRRAMEHLRQQHERHTHYFPPHDRPLYIMEQDHLKPLAAQTALPQRSYVSDLQQGREKNHGKSSPRSDSSAVPSDARTTNCSIPKETEKNMDITSSRTPLSRSEHTPASSSCPRQSHSNASTPAIITSAISPANQTLRSSPRDNAHCEREGDLEAGKDVKQKEHQIMWTRKMFEQKRRLRQEEIEWQHRQQQVRQQKREVQQELYQFRQKLLQQKESELDDPSKKEHGNQPEKEESEMNCVTSNERTKENNTEVQRVNVDKMAFPQYGYPLYHDQSIMQPQTPTMHVPSMYRPPGIQQHEVFYPPGYLPQAPLPPRMDTRMYREYLQQPSHFLDNTAVSEWLEKQRQAELSGDNFVTESHKNSVDRFGPASMVLNGKVKGGEKYNHEPQKLKFMKDLGLMTVSEKKERAHHVFGNGKRKFTEDVNSVEDENESNKENRMENGERIVDSAKKGTGNELDINSETYCKKVDFLYTLGLVTHRKRQELEDDFEKNRWERRTQRLQKRTKRTKREKKEEKERNRSRTPLDLDVSGPITRQKQQLLQEYGLLMPIKDSLDKDSSSSLDSTATDKAHKTKDNETGETKKSKKDDNEVSMKDDSEKTFHNKYEVSTPPPRPSPGSGRAASGPQLTLQSITHMENPYHGFPSAFHPPFYHSGLLSVHQDGAATKDSTLFQNKSSFLNAGGLPKTETDLSGSQTSVPMNSSNNFASVPPTNADMLYRSQNSWLPTNDIFKWPGPNTIVRSYSVYHKEQENEINISKEKAKKMRMENSSLNDESARLNSTYSDLIQSKRKLEEDQRILNGKLEKLRDFLVFVQHR